jgi:PTS system N-acetylglucosamine-specific IIC component
VLYLVHAVLTGTALAVRHAPRIKLGFGFSAGLIDYVLNFSKENTTRPLLLLGPWAGVRGDLLQSSSASL